MESIFQNLPNNLIMNIIKMETDRANEEIRLGLIESKKKFMDCIMQLCEVEEYIIDTLDGQDERDYYLSDARAEYESENGNLFFGCMLSDLFCEIEDSNENNKKDIEEAEYQMSLEEPSEEERYELRCQNENPSEDDYNYYEPDWA